MMIKITEVITTSLCNAIFKFWRDSSCATHACAALWLCAGSNEEFNNWTVAHRRMCDFDSSQSHGRSRQNERNFSIFIILPPLIWVKLNFSSSFI